MKIFFQTLFLAIILTNMTAQSLKTEVDKLIRFDTDINLKKTPGFIIGVIDNDSTYIINYGNKGKIDPSPIVATDIFEIGSVTKAMTASVISILVQQGKLNYDDAVNTYIPNPYKNPRLDKLSIRNLVAHQSGLPKRPLFFGKREKDVQNPYAAYSENDLLKFYSEFIPTKEGFVYSHTNFALLELIITQVTGQPLSDVFDDLLFKPLGMSQSFIDFPEQKVNLIAPGYDRALKMVSPWTFASFKGSEGVKTDMNDLLKYVKAHLNLGSAFDSLFSQNIIPQGQESFNKQLAVSFGWHIIDMDHFNIITHTGKTSGHNAFVGFVKETKTAVVILTNSSSGTEDLGLQLLRMINYNWKRVQS